jgi:poly-beta-1,6-N-acetyl-D-glucosamine synthase
MISFYLLWTGCYFVLLFWLKKKWPKTNLKAKSTDHLPSVSVLIPFRNEMENLETLSKELLEIDYPRLEIILIDDHSEDGSLAFLESYFKSTSQIKILQSPGIGKKKAIEFGVGLSQGNLILCSDADCKFPDNWVRNMVAPFKDSQIQLVAGPVINSRKDNFFQRFQQIEWSSILLLTQFSFGQKRPLMCSGANLAYRKSAFLSVNGYDQNSQHLSGDDEFLLKKICGHFGAESSVYLPFVENLVQTNPLKNVSELLNQRIRWAGKWKIHRDFWHALAAVVSFLIQLIWIGSFTLLGNDVWGVFTFIVVVNGKVISEKLALGMVLEKMKMHHSYVDFLKTGIIHPIYVISVAIGAIRGKFTWKGRSQ